MTPQDDRALLSELARIFPWHDDRGVNIRAFCDGSWEHHADCLWVRIRAHLGLEGTP